jgi:hypothetical protein
MSYARNFGEDFLDARFGHGFLDRDGEQVKGLIFRGDYGLAVAVVSVLASAKMTLKPRKRLPPDPELRAKALGMIQAAAACDPRVGRQLRNFRTNPIPHAPAPLLGLNEYGPQQWQELEDMLLIMRIPQKAFVHQAKSRDGWWNKRGRQIAAYKNIARTLAHDLFAR